MRGRLLAAFLVVTAPLFLVLAAWQAGRHALLAEETRRLEATQRAWLEANEKLEGGIAVLESRERAADLARRLGLEPADPGRRVFVTISADDDAGARP